MPKQTTTPLPPLSPTPPDPHLSGFTHRGSCTAANDIALCGSHMAAAAAVVVVSLV